MDLMTAVTAGLAIFFVISILFAMIRKSPRAKLRLITVIISAVGAFVLTIFLKGNLDMILEDHIIPRIYTAAPEFVATFNELMALSPTLVHLVESSACAILAPLLFLVLFLALMIVSWVVFFVFSLLLAIPFHHAKSSSFTSALCGALQAFIVAFAILIPVACYTEYAPTVMNELAESGILPEEQAESIKNKDNEIVAIMDQVNNAPIITVSRSMGVKPIYVMLTDIKLENGVSTHLEDEISALTHFVCDVYELSQNTDIAGYGPEQAQILLHLSVSFGDSKLLPSITGEFIYAVTEKWIAGETFWGLAQPSLGEILDPFFNRLISLLHDDARDIEHLSEDVSTAAKLLAVLAENRVFSHISDTDALLSAISEGDTLKDMIMTLGENPRMNVLISDITNIGLRAVAQALNVPENSDVIYNNFISNVTNFLNESSSMDQTERASALCDKLTTELDDAGIVLDTSLVSCFSTAMLEDIKLLNGEPITTDFVKDFFTAYSEATGGSMGGSEGETIPLSYKGSPEFTVIDFTSSAYKGMTKEQLIANTFIGKLAFIIGEAASIPENSTEKEALIESTVRTTLDSYLSSMENDKADEAVTEFITSLTSAKDLKKSEEIVTSIASAETLITNIVTLDDILGAAGDRDLSGENIEKEAEALSQIIGKTSEIVGLINNNDGKMPEISEITSVAGSMLNLLGDTPTIGKEATGLLFTSLVQSKSVRESTGLSTEEAKAIADSVSNGIGDYEAAFETVDVGLNLVTSLTSGNMTGIEDIEKLIKVMNATTAEMISTHFNADRLAQYGFKPEKAETAAEFISVLTTNIANHDAEHKQEDVEAVRHMFNLAITASGKTDGKTLFGEEGKLGDANAVVNTIMDSSLVYETLIEVMTEDGAVKDSHRDVFGIGDKLGENDAELIADAVADYLAEHADRALEAEAILALLGIEND